MPQWSFQAYREFWDVPRMVVATNESGTYLFHSRFDETLDEYIDHYEVHQLPPLSANELQGSWADLPSRSLKRLDDVPLRQLPFEITRPDFRDFDSEFTRSDR
jgi:hypothetical protein